MSRHRLQLFLVFSFLLALSCSHSNKKQSEDPAKNSPVQDKAPDESNNDKELTDRPPLLRSEAQERFELIEGVSYQLSLEMDGSSTYFGNQEIQFRLKKNPSNSVRVDFDRGEILEIFVNGKSSKVE